MINENRLIELLEDEILRVNTESTPGCGNLYGRDASVMRNTLNYVIDLINEQPKVNEWIPVEERFPEEREFVIVLAKNHGMDIGCLTDNEWYCSGYELSLNKIIAWMPLPESYKGGTE